MRSIPFSPLSSSLPIKGETCALPILAPLVAACTAAACSCEKQSVIFTLIPDFKACSAALRPSCVVGSLTCAFGIHENISLAHLIISSDDVLESEYTSMETDPSGIMADTS